MYSEIQPFPPMRRSPRFLRSLVIASILILPALTIGCTPKIPNKITSQEMDLYREWLKQRFANKAPEHLYLDDQTFRFDPLRQEGCGKALHTNDDVSNSLMRALHNLGNTDYEIDVSPKAVHIPWPYQVLNVRDFPRPVEGLHVISFSRVAFNGSGRSALFAVNDLCGPQCGRGRAVSATKENDAWRFKDSTTCSWEY